MSFTRCKEKARGVWAYDRGKSSMKYFNSYYTDNPREACWLANKYGGTITKRSEDERECVNDGERWSVKYTGSRS